LAAYQVSSLADDLFYQVTHVVRGEDLLSSTAMQLFLDAQLTKPAFHRTTFWHHPLLQDAAGRKLSKSVGAAIPAQPASVNLAELLPQFCHWMGWPIVASPRLRDLIGHPDLLLPER
jgi:glutamyl/glutaminyl-tRNA synthetase